jgi:hypothetical protein
MQNADYFPATRRSRIVGWVGQGDRASLRQHLLSVYYEPIRLYLKGSAWFSARIKRMGRGDARAHGEIEELNELVNGFFSDLLDREGFFGKWLASERRLSRYLRGALWLYLKRRFRDEPREVGASEDGPESLDAPVEEEPPERELDKAFVVGLVAQAMEEARVACEKKGLAAHWSVLMRHVCDGASYPELARELDVGPDRAAVMLRTAAMHFERSFRSLVSQQVQAPEHVRRAIESFVEVVES